MTLPQLTIESFMSAAATFAADQKNLPEPLLFGVTDGKAIGTHIERKFKAALAQRFSFKAGNSASGLDFPDLDVDLKVTSAKQPQSSCPFRSARQKVFGLGYSLLLFVYTKADNDVTKESIITISNTVFINAEATGDYTLTKTLIQMHANGANEEDIMAYLFDRNLPIDDIEAQHLAQDILQCPPRQGYLTISNALQWRLQYSHAINQAGQADGVTSL